MTPQRLRAQVTATIRQPETAHPDDIDDITNALYREFADVETIPDIDATRYWELMTYYDRRKFAFTPYVGVVQ